MDPKRLSELRMLLYGTGPRPSVWPSDEAFPDVARLREMTAELVDPMHGEIAELRHQLWHLHQSWMIARGTNDIHIEQKRALGELVKRFLRGENPRDEAVWMVKEVFGERIE